MICVSIINGRGNVDLAIFTTPEAWISLVTLLFLEIVLGVDNLVFIAITTNRLPEDKQHLGRKIGLAGALVMRIVFLCLASFLVHMVTPLFTLDFGSFSHGFSMRDLVLLAGGIYLIYKGIAELRDLMNLTELKAEHGSVADKKLHQLTLAKAVATIMVMDLVFSIDSVITAVGLAQYLIIMILAVMIAVFIMMAFIDPISDFINRHPEMKILALCFIVVIGALLAFDGLGIHSGVEILEMSMEKLMVYFAMVFAFLLELVQMAYNKSFNTWRKSIWREETESQIGRVREEMLVQIESERLSREKATQTPSGEVAAIPRGMMPPTPVFIGSNVYIMMPVEDHDASSFKDTMASFDDTRNLLSKPIEIDAEFVEVSEEIEEDEKGKE